jgi:ketosteroid isomerase-like protein
MTKPFETVEQAYKLARRTDHQALRELIADDARWEPAPKARWNPCRNGDQIVQTLVWRASMANRLRPVDPITLGNRVLIRLRGKRLGRLGAPGFVPKLFQIVEVRDGKIVHMQDYGGQEEALTAAGIRRE